MAGSAFFFTIEHEAIIPGPSVGNNVSPADVQKSLKLGEFTCPFYFGSSACPFRLIVLLMLFGVLHI